MWYRATETILEEDTKTPFCLHWSKLISTVIYLFYTETSEFLLITYNYCSRSSSLFAYFSLWCWCWKATGPPTVAEKAGTWEGKKGAGSSAQQGKRRNHPKMRKDRPALKGLPANVGQTQTQTGPRLHQTDGLKLCCDREFSPSLSSHTPPYRWRGSAGIKCWSEHPWEEHRDRSWFR